MPGRNQTALQIAYLFPRRYAPGYAPSGDDCLPWFQQDRYQAFVEARQVSLRKRRPGRDPSHGGTAGQKRANSQIRRQRELQEWKASNGDQPADPAVFEREILPLLQNMPPSLIVRATGLTSGYIAQILRGDKTPHPRHWEAFRTLLAREIAT